MTLFIIILVVCGGCFLSFVAIMKTIVFEKKPKVKKKHFLTALYIVNGIGFGSFLLDLAWGVIGGAIYPNDATGMGVAVLGWLIVIFVLIPLFIIDGLAVFFLKGWRITYQSP